MATRKPVIPRPTQSELEILSVLWQRGPSTVRDVHNEMNRTKETGYTTVLKFLQIMTEKGLVERNESERAHIYLARVPQSTTQRQMVGDLLNRVFDGSARNLVLHALSAHGHTDGPALREQLRTLLKDREE